MTSHQLVIINWFR